MAQNVYSISKNLSIVMIPATPIFDAKLPPPPSQNGPGGGAPRQVAEGADFEGSWWIPGIFQPLQGEHKRAQSAGQLVAEPFLGSPTGSAVTK